MIHKCISKGGGGEPLLNPVLISLFFQECLCHIPCMCVLSVEVLKHYKQFIDYSPAEYG